MMFAKRKPLVVGAAILAFCFLLAPTALAFEGRAGDTIVVGPDEIIADDLYATGNSIRVEGRIEGDLIAVAQTVIVNGQVDGDMLAAGQTVTVGGTIADDVRITGATLSLDDDADVGDDVVAAGYSFDAAPGSSIAGTFLYGGNQARLAGEVAGDVEVGAAGVEISGHVGGDVNADVGTPDDISPISPFAFMPGASPAPAIAGGLTVSDSAEIDGSLAYTSSRQFSIPSGAVAGALQFQDRIAEEQAAQQRSRILQGVLRHLRRGIALLLVGLLLLWIAPSWTGRAAAQLRVKPLPSVGWGLVAFASFLAAILVAILVGAALSVSFGFINLGNLALASAFLGAFTVFALALIFGLAAAFLTKVLVSYWGGRLILAQFGAEPAERAFWSLLLGITLLVPLLAIPVLGGVLNLIAVTAGLGALWLLVREQLPRPGEANAPAA